MSKIELCLLDFDGTLFDTLESLKAVFIESFKEVGIKISEDECLELTRIQLKDGFKLKGGSPEKLLDYYAAIEKYLNSDLTVRQTKLYDDTLAFIDRAKELKLPIGIVTSNNIGHVHEVLDFLNIDKSSFVVYVGNRETKLHKPNPDPILKALDFYAKDVDKNKVYYVGDGYADMDSAVRAGVMPILLDRYNEYKDSPYQVIHSLIEVFKLL